IPAPLNFVVEKYLLAERIFSGKCSPRHRLADDDASESRMVEVKTGAVAVCEGAAATKWNACSFEVCRIDAPFHPCQKFSRRERAPVHVIKQDVARAGQRCAGSDPSRPYTRQALQAVAQLVQQCDSLCRLCIMSSRRSESHCHCLLDASAGRNLVEK